MQKELARLLAQALVADYERTIARWAKVRQFPSGGSGSVPPRCHARVASVKGRRVFTMVCAEWERLRGYEAQLVEIDLERTPSDGVAEPAAVIAGLAPRLEARSQRAGGSPRPHRVGLLGHAGDLHDD